MAKLAGSSILFSFLFSLSLVAMNVAEVTSEDAPVLFIFGDSTADVGTNNFLNTRAKANFLYYGIDFPYSIPTGRFSNGFNTADQIARLFGYKTSPPPFLVLEERQFSFKKNILNGVNFASAGSGILEETGLRQWGEVVSLGEQVQQFALVHGNISEILGQAKAASYFSRALFLFSTGSNDLFDYSRNESGSIRLGKEEYLTYMQQNFYVQIRKLYNLGARRFGIVSIPPLGCCPAIRALNRSNGGKCVVELNDFAYAFYQATESLLKRLSFELKDFKYSLSNSIAMTLPVLNSPQLFGIKDTISACCGTGYLNGEGGCSKPNNTDLCKDRSDHLFWDLFHPTEKASELAALTLFQGSLVFMSPLNFSQLARTA
ncbi:hypothetical protein L6164_016847 [Bauhinia variegata]|uniref:Uncharacterized protein n=1 Tax=Bauhinia variegata TaxID=167791 RepID=A0ACB9N7X9_BAUVA|nr:hypothetical protein L6164_016847 [Bauhinia variegata]